jgi:membrane fusion protein, multidrug efflux system
MKNIRHIALTVLVAATAPVLQNCGSSKAEEEENKKKPVEAHALETFTLQKHSLASSLQIPGELIAFQQVDLYAKVSSFVKKLHADVGT